MKHFDLCVIGSGPAGVSAAAAYASAGGPGSIGIITADIDAPYMRPPLSKDALQSSGEVEPTPVGPEMPSSAELLLDTTVTALDLHNHTLTAGGATIGYARLVIATGAAPSPFDVAEADAEVHMLRSLASARRLDTAAQHARTAVVIGSGFIGCEAAASLAIRGLDVTIVTPDDGPQHARLGEFAAHQITAWLTALGVTIRTGARVTGVDAPRTVHLDDGHTLAPELVLAAIGITPAAADLVEGSGLQTYEGRVVADEYLQAAPDVWVAGDSARAHNATAARPLAVEHWGDALSMGELAGRNAAAAAGATDAQHPWDAVPGFFSEIGEHTLKYAAWGDGHATADVVERAGSFTVWYGDANERVVGVLTYNADDDYERGSALIAQGATLTEARSGARPTPEESEAAPSDQG